jgi:hypothetical protein
MTRLNFLKSAVIAASAVFFLSSCGDKEEPNETPFNQTVNADETTGKSGVTFVTSGAWTSSITEGTTKSTKAETDLWISIDPDHGDAAGEYTITIHLQKNDTGEERSATITISFDDMDITITVTQRGTGGVSKSGITYPATGKGGPNILADEVVKVKRTEWGIFEYSVRAVVPAGNSSLKIVLKTDVAFTCSMCGFGFPEEIEKCSACGGTERRPADPNYIAWGGYYPSSEVNWVISRFDSNLRGNTFTVYESGKPADVTVTFSYDCIIEYYENGATTPTKTKRLEVEYWKE